MIRRSERPVNKPTWATIRNWGLGGRAAVVAAVLLLLYAAVAPWAYWLSGGAGLLAAGIAAAVCLLGAVAALFLSHRFRGPAHACTRSGLFDGRPDRTSPDLGAGDKFFCRAPGKSGHPILSCGLLSGGDDNRGAFVAHWHTVVRCKGREDENQIPMFNDQY